MQDLVNRVIDVVVAQPMVAVGCAIVVLLYLSLMSGPRVR